MKIIRSGFASSFSIASGKDAVNTPVTPSSISSGMPPERYAITGTPAENASRITRGVASIEVDDTTRTSSSANTLQTSSDHPGKRTGSPALSART